MREKKARMHPWSTPRVVAVNNGPPTTQVTIFHEERFGMSRFQKLVLHCMCPSNVLLRGTSCTLLMLFAAGFAQTTGSPAGLQSGATTAQCSDTKMGALIPSSQRFKDGYAKGQKDALDRTRSAYTVKVSNGTKHKIRVVVETIDGAESYRRDAALVIKDFFADFLEIDDNADLYLHITGTPKMRFSSTDVQYVEASVYALAVKDVVAGSDGRRLRGTFRLANSGDLVGGYDDDQKRVAISQLVKNVLSQYERKWKEGRPLHQQ